MVAVSDGKKFDLSPSLNFQQMPVFEAAAVAIAAEVGSRGYDWIKQTSGEKNTPLLAAQAVTDGTDCTPSELRTAFARATNGDGYDAFRGRPRDEIIVAVARELPSDCDREHEQLVRTYLEELETRLVAQSDGGSPIVLEYLRQLKADVTQLRDDIRQSNYYRVFDADEFDSAIELLREQLTVPDDGVLVERPELEGPIPQQQLLLGRKGSGKSWSLFHQATRLIDSGSVTEVLIPTNAAQRVDDIKASFSREYQGDVLLVWDDIHHLSRFGDANAFYETVLKLGEVLDPDQSLYVLASCRSEQRSRLPQIDQRRDDPVWQTFDVTRLKPLTDETLTTILDEKIAAYDLSLTETAYEWLIRQVQVGHPSPFYIDSACSYLATEVAPNVDQINVSDIVDIPAFGLQIWEDQYQNIRDSAPNERRVLMAIRLLMTVTDQIQTPLVKGLFETVFEGDPLEFDPAIDRLDRKQWLTTGSSRDEIQIHAIQIEAVDEDFETLYDDLASFLLGDATAVIDTERAIGLAMNLAVDLLADPEVEDEDLIEDVAEYVLDDSRTGAVDEDIRCGLRINYAGYLGLNDRPMEALEQAAWAIQAKPDLPKSYIQYAVAADMLDESRICDRAFTRAIDLADSGTFEARIRVRWAEILISRRSITKARKLLQQAVEQTDDPKVYQRSALFFEQIDKIGIARSFHERAMEESDSIKTKQRYARFLSEYGPVNEFEGLMAEIQRETPDEIESIDDVYNALLAPRKQFSPETHNQPVDPDSEAVEEIIDEAWEIAEADGFDNAAEWLANNDDDYESSSLYFSLGSLHTRAGNIKSAMDAYTTGFELATDEIPDYAYGEYVNRAVNYFEDHGNAPEKAVELIDDAINYVNPKDEITGAVLGRLLRLRFNLEAIDAADAATGLQVIGMDHIFRQDIENAMNCFRDVWQYIESIDDTELKEYFGVRSGTYLLAIAEIQPELKSDLPVADIDEFVRAHLNESDREYRELYSEVQLLRGEDPVIDATELPVAGVREPPTVEVDEDIDEPEITQRHIAAVSTVRALLIEIQNLQGNNG
ncbi:hypothetical protein [Halobellus inordinatus]|uniref:hypothetical protein n=1 Tax=Halobellus inordinatus TaxID=1126236 RepID=UPI0021145EC5|nr:hypothetical protein [Halobellus ramosii]